MPVAKTRRRRPREETAKARRARACAAHLRDLVGVHSRPPPDVKLAPVPIPRRFDPVPLISGCSSPARMCAELAS